MKSKETKKLMDEFNEDFSDMEGLFDTTLPDPTMVEFYRRLKNREILWNDDIDDATIDIALYIKKWNDEDKDLAIEGYLKGSIEEKSEPYFEPFYEALDKIGVNRNTAFYDSAVNEKYQTAYIQCVTHTFLRGTNFENKVVIIDEAQNYYFDELKKVLTRLHDSCKIIVIGHDGQNDLFDHPERSGFVPYLNWFSGDDRVAVCRLTENHRGWISQHADELTFRAAMKYVEDQ
mgnify:CR=1 FL=1